MTPLNLLYALVTLLVALSLASERLVEIIKGMVPFLNTENPDAQKERLRRLVLHLLAVAAGMLTAYLAKPVISDAPAFKEVIGNSGLGQVWALGLLASGGSSFWNSILSYLLKVKNIKEAEAVQKQVQAEAMAKEAGNIVALQNLRIGN
jgi:hypothetical protein